MRKTANLLLLMILFFMLSFETNVSSSALDNPKTKTFSYEQFKVNQELDRRAIVEQQLIDSLRTKPSIKWVLTGFTDTQIFVESSGRQSAISPEGAQGIAQFMPSTWKTLIDMKLLPEWFDINNEAHQRIAQLVYLDYLYNLWDAQIRDQSLEVSLTKGNY